MFVEPDGLGRRLHVRKRVVVQGQLGGSEARHRQLRQHHLRDAHRLPVHHDGRMDDRPLLRTYRRSVLNILDPLLATQTAAKGVVMIVCRIEIRKMAEC